LDPIKTKATKPHKYYLTMTQRLALIIGNSEYESGRLNSNPIDDANGMENELKKLDFSVRKRTNLDLNSMQKEIDRFLSKIKKHDIVFFYFSGHKKQESLYSVY
jgi:uncharacterized caspase-like protein